MSTAAPPENDRTVTLGAPGSPPPAAESGVSTHNALPVGTRLSEFEILGLIGEGGFGIVYLAYDSSLERRVALKEYMPSALAQRKATGSGVALTSQRHAETFAAGLRSFINEARLLAQFDHPALVKVYRFWEANGTAYMVMPFYQGVTLGEALRKLSTAPDENWIKTLLAQLLDALEIIHERQCYHRDIAPDNILMLSDDAPLLLDFGAARQVIGGMTQALTVILKPGYAPIEQYAEAPGMQQGPWTDLYALASVVYFAVTGKAPVPAVARVMSDPLVPLANVARGRYSEEFLHAIDVALAVKPEDRPQSVAEFRAALKLESWHIPTRLRAPRTRTQGAVSRQPRTSSRKTGRTRRYVIASVTVLAVLALAFGLAQLWPTKKDPDKPGGVAQTSPAPPARAGVENEGPDATLRPEDFATGAANVFARFDCAWLNARLDGHTAVVSGNVAEAADLQAINEGVRRIAGVRDVNRDEVRVIPRPHCFVASVLARYVDPAAKAPRIALKGGATSLSEGQKLVAEVVAADFPGLLYADLYDPNGSVAHILPNSKDRHNRADARQRMTLGERGMQWEIVPPLGKHLLVVVASSTPLFAHNRGQDVEDTEPYLRALAESIRGKPSKDRVAVHYTLIDFVPKR